MTQPPYKKNNNLNKKNINNNVNKNPINKNISININNSNNSKKRSSITVAVRVRPLNQNELEISTVETIKVINNNSLLITIDSSSNSKKSNQIKEQQFFFDYVFDKNTSQQTIYDYTTKHLLVGLLEGFNATVFAYGATGAGKTYTMLGTSIDKGIMPRSITDLFKLLNNYNNKEFKMIVAYIEIYNEIIRDLLGNGKVIDITEDPGKGVILIGANEMIVDNTEKFYDLLYIGNNKRTTGSTNNNECSSRSHAVLRINIDSIDRESNDIISGKFILVDLAGSEKTSANQNNTINQERQKEGININKSLLALGLCINVLASKSKSKFVPWRNSKLTRILKDSLGGNSRIVMISNVSPSTFNVEETLNTLIYSNRAKNIQTIIKKNIINTADRDSQVNKYDEIISNLTSELELLRQQLAVKTHNKHLLPKKEISSPNLQINSNSKMEKLSKEINSHFNEERRYKTEILEIRRNINNLIANLKDKEFSLYKVTNRQEMSKSFSVRNILAQNYLRKVPKTSTFKEKELKGQIKALNEQIMSHRELLAIKENKYNEIVARRANIEKIIGKYGNSVNINSNSNNYKENIKDFNALQYLYQSYILEINNMENDFIRKQSLNEIRTKDIKIHKLVEQLKIRDEYINQEKKQLAKKKINYHFEGEKDIKNIEELNIDKNYSLPIIIEDNNISSSTTNKLMGPSLNLKRVNQMSNGRYDYSGYCNPNIIKEKKVIKTKTNEIMKKTKKSELTELKLNMLNDQYKNSKVFYVNKGSKGNNNLNLSYSEEPNVITFDTKQLNKSHSNASLSFRSQNDSLNASSSNRIYNYKEREIDNKIKKIMVLKKKMSPYVK